MKDDNKLLAIELAKAFIQNNSVKPIYDINNEYDPALRIKYLVDDTEYAFFQLVEHFLSNIEIVDKWD
ncbi:hypothetical protein QUF73_07600 [Cytobacillus sp. NJ13]|nr:hypothetical protein [Cytobacillus sp. NJ13]